MLVSVIVPSYNQAAYLEATLRSILEQDHRDVEVIVNDGGSTDGSVEILKKYDGRIRWKSQRDYGQTDAINQGLREARGQILAYLNSDDIYLPGAVATVVRHFRENPRSLIAYGRADHLQADGSFLEEYPTEPWNYDRLFETCIVCQPAVFWRRELVTRFGYFDERLNYSMDYDYWLRVGAQLPLHYLGDQPKLAGSRLHADTKTLGSRLPVHREIFQMVRRHARRPEECYTWLRHLASIQAREDGHAPSSDPAVHARHAREYARNVLIEAEAARLELSDALVHELEQLHQTSAAFV